jgi:hypothetical protein
MMRFIFLFVLFIVGVGLMVHSGVEVPYLQWMGHLPGDLIIRKRGAIIYMPLTTSLIISLVLSILLHQGSRPPR